VRHAYTLTPKGSALGDVLLAFVRWGKQHIPGTVTLNEVSAGVSAASAANSRRTRAKRVG
jgi:DNA-binding HxlR family transcriptional regulator